MNLCACRYEPDDLDVDKILDVMMMTTLMNVKVGGDSFPYL